MKHLYMIGNAHLDPVWLWNWKEGFQENKATCRSALDRLNEYEDAVFTSSSAQFYEWIEENEPEMFEEIRQRVKEGRWVICGGWWVQPDCNIPGGESFARHALISQNYFREKFGVIAKTGYNVDSFGHNGMLPQILRLSGMENYVFMRPGPHEKGLPGRNFLWESDDGSRVLVFRIPFAYCTFENLEEHMKTCLQEFDPAVDDLMCFYGVGNHGGGPTIENIEHIRRLQTEWKDVEITFSDPDKYFENIKDKYRDLPVVHGDLQHHASGCYSAHSGIKKLNRKAENDLLRGEKFSVLSEVIQGAGYPDNYSHAWKRVLFQQFHDILAGSSIESAYEDAQYEMGEAIAIASRNENHALQAISFRIHIEQEEKMIPVVIFNPHSWEVKEHVEVETGRYNHLCSGEMYLVRDSDGREVPCQIVTAQAKMNGTKRVVFTARIPALGYAVYKIYVTGQAEAPAVNAMDRVLENQKLRIRFDEKTGTISSVRDKETKTEYCREGFGRAAVIKDDSDTWAHDVLRFRDLEGCFTPVSIKKTEDGPVRTSIRVISRYHQSELTQTYTLYTDEDTLHVQAKLNWQEKFRCLKLQFPVNVEEGRGTYEIPFGSIEKACNGEEEPVQRWMDLSGISGNNLRQIYGISIINNGKYSACMEKNQMELTILRSPVYAHHNPHILQEEECEYQFMEQGEQRFRYDILPHAGSWKNASVVKRAEEMNQPCPVVIESYHKGTYGQKAGYIGIDKENIILSALKKADSLDGYIARFYETDGKFTETEITMGLFGQKISASFRPYEIKTYKICPDSDEKPAEVNFMEWAVV